MVDAISAVNSAINPIVQQRKDQSIDWNKLTASEILEYAGQGQDVPSAILQWAEDYSKIENAPDDVSYESVNGSTDVDEVNAQTSSTDGPGADDAADKMAMTTAQQDRQNLIDSGTSLYDQGRIFVERSDSSTGAVTEMEGYAQSSAKNSEETAVKAADRAGQTVNSTRSIREEYTALIRKVQSDMKNVTPGDLNRIQQLGTQLNMYGTRAQAELANYDIQLQQIDEQFAQYQTLPQEANDYGSQTVDIGTSLVQNNPNQQETVNTALIENIDGATARAALREARMSEWHFIFERDYQMGLNALESGAEALDSGAEGQSVLDDAVNRNQQSVNEVNNAELRVEESTFIEGFERPAQTNGDENNPANANQAPENNSGKNQESSQTTSANKTDDNGVKDTALLTDPLEIQRRKEQLGLA